MRLYIAGPITGVEGYQAAFDAASARLRTAGYDVRNPAGLMLPDWRARDSEWVAWMRASTRLLTDCDGVPDGGDPARDQGHQLVTSTSSWLTAQAPTVTDGDGDGGDAPEGGDAA